MFIRRMLSVAIAGSFVLAPAASFAVDASSASVSSVSSSAEQQSSVRVDRCKRFSRGSDYDRCVQLLRRLPERRSSSSSSDASDTSSDLDWKWTNFLNRIEEKLGSTVKFVAVLSKQFCKDRTDENSTTSRECMSRVGDEVQARMTKLINTTFRAELPSAR